MSAGAGFRVWLQGARPRTLGAAIAPVFVGSVLAANDDAFDAIAALLALVVALSLQIGVNYANDYSDGIRGTDRERVGPVRLVGQGLASPTAVKAAAFICFGIAGLAGLALSLYANEIWLILIGLLAILAAWFYTGGQKPYGYRGFGEVVAFVFFGPIALIGTYITQAQTFAVSTLWAGTAMGAFAAALLLVNNIRDVPSDLENGKITLAVRLGVRRARWLYFTLLFVPFLCLVPLAQLVGLGCLLALVATPLALGAFFTTRPIKALSLTSLAELTFALGFSFGLVLLG